MACSSWTYATSPCASTLRGLHALAGGQDLALSWRETSMDDGKPLLLSIYERDGALALRFVKSGEGLWAESEFVVCPKGAGIEARPAGPIQVGPAANWLTRMAFARGGRFLLTRPATGALQVDTAAWSGTFAPTGP